MVTKRGLFPTRFLLLLLIPVFLASFFLIRGNDIRRRVPILLSSTAISTCQSGYPSLSVFGSDPYGLMQQGTDAVAFFYVPNKFGECTMNFLNGSWHTLAHLNPPTTSATPIVVGLYGAQPPGAAKIVVGGLVEPSIQKLELVLPDGSRTLLAIRDHLFYDWIRNPVRSPNSTTPKLLGFNSDGTLVYSVELSTTTSSRS